MARPSAYSDLGSRTRLASVQLCPDMAQAAAAAAGRHVRRSASSRTMYEDLPPRSRNTFLTVGAAAARTLRPVAVEPVNVIMSTRGSALSAAPTSLAFESTTLKIPGGMSVFSATIRPSSLPDQGVSWAGLSTTALPAMRAGTDSAMFRYSGAFHGVIAPTTPTASYCRTRRTLTPKLSWMPVSRQYWKVRPNSGQWPASLIGNSSWIELVLAMGAPTSVTMIR